jgi:hypothetical protein
MKRLLLTCVAAVLMVVATNCLAAHCTWMSWRMSVWCA